MQPEILEQNTESTNVKARIDHIIDSLGYETPKMNESEKFLISFDNVSEMTEADWDKYRKLSESEEESRFKEKKRIDAIPGWDNLKVKKIDKYGAEAVMYTTAGTMKIPMKDLFLQPNFRSKVFETFGIMVQKMKIDQYESYLAEWSKTITDMGMEYGTSIEVMRDALIEYLEGATDRDLAYLKKGNPILLPEGVVAFKSIDFTIWTKKNYQMNYTEDQIRSVLKEMGCKPRQMGPTRLRVWTYRMPEIEAVPQPGQVEISFETKGKAPELMSDESNQTSLMDDDY